MKHGLPETIEENFEIRLKRINQAEKSLRRCYEFNDTWVTSEIDRALNCTNLARAIIEIDKENHVELAKGEKHDMD